MSERRLDGSVALISGGLRGIGLAITERFVAEGARVVIGDLTAPDDREVVELLTRLGPAISYVPMNVTEEADWRRTVEHVRERHARLDVLVNNAGVDLSGAIETVDFTDWRRLMAVNVDGVFLGTKSCTSLLARSGADRRGGSSVINMSSVLGLVGMNGCSAYSTSKGAIRSFTKGMAIEYAQSRMPIRVNSMHPAFCMTPLLQKGFRNMVAKGLAGEVQDLIDQVSAATPMGRLAEPAEIAGAAFFLASVDSSYVTGTELVVDGGWTAQ
jgi:NAD(P)-dependent dehydrogenase (short-subunit alcohol dehydrogenase family)